MRRLAVVTVAVGAVLTGAGPAWAHEEINPATVASGKPAFLTLTAANEKSSNLTKVTLNAPGGLAFGAATDEPAGWSVDRSDAVITWTGGTVGPDRFAQWGFEIEGADQPGTVTYQVIMGFADGSSERADVPLTVVAGTGVAIAPTTPPAGSATTVAPSPPTTHIGAPAKVAAGSSGRSRANWALAVAILALLTAVVALLLTAVRSRSAPSAVAPGPPPSRPSDAQDW